MKSLCGLTCWLDEREPVAIAPAPSRTTLYDNVQWSRYITLTRKKLYITRQRLFVVLETGMQSTEGTFRVTQGHTWWNCSFIIYDFDMLLPRSEYRWSHGFAVKSRKVWETRLVAIHFNNQYSWCPIQMIFVSNCSVLFRRHFLRCMTTLQKIVGEKTYFGNIEWRYIFEVGPLSILESVP